MNYLLGENMRLNHHRRNTGDQQHGFLDLRGEVHQTRRTTTRYNSHREEYIIQPGCQEERPRLRHRGTPPLRRKTSGQDVTIPSCLRIRC